MDCCEPKRIRLVPGFRVMHSDSPEVLKDRIFKARAAAGALEMMERELGVIAKAGCLRSYKTQISDIRRAIRNLIATLERTANQTGRDLKRQQKSTG